jgi:hypothetical protein
VKLTYLKLKDFFILLFALTSQSLKKRRVVRVAEGARLESVYMPKVYREFESLTLRQLRKKKSRRMGMSKSSSDIHSHFLPIAIGMFLILNSFISFFF